MSEQRDYKPGREREFEDEFVDERKDEVDRPPAVYRRHGADIGEVCAYLTGRHLHGGEDNQHYEQGLQGNAAPPRIEEEENRERSEYDGQIHNFEEERQEDRPGKQGAVEPRTVAGSI